MVEKGSEKKKSSNRPIAMLSMAAFVILLIAAMVLMIRMPEQYMLHGVLLLCALVAASLFAATLIREMAQEKELFEEKYQSLDKAGKATYILVKRLGEQLNGMQGISAISEETAPQSKSASMPSEQNLINAQKAAARVIVSRSQENTRELLNANNKVLEQIYEYQEKLESYRTEILEMQKSIFELTRQDHEKMQEAILQGQMVVRDSLEEQLAGTKDSLEEQLAGTKDSLEEQLAGTKDSLMEEVLAEESDLPTYPTEEFEEVIEVEPEEEIEADVVLEETIPDAEIVEEETTPEEEIEEGEILDLGLDEEIAPEEDIEEREEGETSADEEVIDTDTEGILGLDFDMADDITLDVDGEEAVDLDIEPEPEEEVEPELETEPEPDADEEETIDFQSLIDMIPVLEAETEAEEQAELETAREQDDETAQDAEPEPTIAENQALTVESEPEKEVEIPKPAGSNQLMTPDEIAALLAKM
jgi:hypothetical protein